MLGLGVKLSLFEPLLKVTFRLFAGQNHSAMAEQPTKWNAKVITLDVEI